MCTGKYKKTNLEYLKAINVEDSNAELFIRFLDGFIDGLEWTKYKVCKLC